MPLVFQRQSPLGSRLWLQTSMTDIDDLAGRVQGFPSELYDYIYTAVFTPFAARIVVSERYKPPPPLQIDRRSRALYAMTYYGNSVFVFDADDFFHAWLKALSKANFALLSEVHVINKTLLDPARLQGTDRPRSSKVEDTKRTTRGYLTYAESIVSARLEREGITTDGIVIQVEKHFRSDGGAHEVMICSGQVGGSHSRKRELMSELVQRLIRESSPAR